MTPEAHRYQRPALERLLAGDLYFLPIVYPLRAPGHTSIKKGSFLTIYSIAQFGMFC